MSDTALPQSESIINTQLEKGPGEAIDPTPTHVLFNKASHTITLNYPVFRNRRDKYLVGSTDDCGI